jgi:leucyl aminopeptidase (aminopeptidase T)
LPGQHTPELDRLYEQALRADASSIDRQAQKTIEVLRLGTVRMSTPSGTDLMFRVGKRPFNIQNGDASPERAATARVRVDRHIELPAGVIRVAPVEDSISGQIAIPEARFGDTVARKIFLQIDNGRITRIRAEEGLDAVTKALAAGGDAAQRVREFALGLNPELTGPVDGIIPYYGYGAGMVRVSLGDNEELGGAVRGDFVRWFFFPNATVHVDFRYIVKDGKLVH